MRKVTKAEPKASAANSNSGNVLTKIGIFTPKVNDSLAPPVQTIANVCETESSQLKDTCYGATPLGKALKAWVV